MIAAVIIFTTALKSSGWLDVIETTGLDAMSREVAAHQPRRAQRFEHVTIVGIGDAEYKTLFHDTSPLNADLLFATIEKIESLHPVAIGVDIATASNVYASERFRATGTAPIVWATVRRPAENGSVDRLMPVLYGHRDLLRPIDVAADAEFPSLNLDGVLRNYAWSYPLADPAPPGGTRIPSFATALAMKFCAANAGRPCHLSDPMSDGSDAAPGDDPLIDYSGECYAPASSDACVAGRRSGERARGPRPYMDFRTLDAHAKLQRTLCPRAEPACAGDGVFEGRIVLLGGFFTDGGDVHPTPFGLREGVEIWARTIDTEIDGTGRKPVGETVLLVSDIVIALLLTAVGWFFRFLPGLVIAVAVPIVLLAASFAFFGLFGAWLDVIPMSVGVILHNLGEHGTEYVKLRRAEEAREREGEPEDRREAASEDAEASEAGDLAEPLLTPAPSLETSETSETSETVVTHSVAGPGAIAEEASTDCLATPGTPAPASATGSATAPAGDAAELPATEPPPPASEADRTEEATPAPHPDPAPPVAARDLK